MNSKTPEKTGAEAPTESKNQWQRTSTTNLTRHASGLYYARVKVAGKLKFRALGTKVLSVAKARLPDVEKELRGAAATAAAINLPVPEGLKETSVGRFIAAFRAETEASRTLAPATKSRREIAVKALLKTWPELPNLDARRVTAAACRQWSESALRNGTGFVAPRAKAVRTGMSASAFNKCHEALKAIFEIARKHGVVYVNPAEEVQRATLPKPDLNLPTSEQFAQLVQAIAEAGARQSKDCADMVRLLAFSGVRLEEGNSLRWSHVDLELNRLRVPGTKSAASDRTIPLFPPLAALLREIKERRGKVSPDSPVLAVNECKGALRSACKTVGIATLTHHDLRHLFATRCIESGVDIPTVSRWLGHSDGGALAMRTYGHLRDQHSQAAALKVTF